MAANTTTLRIVLYGLGFLALMQSTITTAGPILLSPGTGIYQVEVFEPIGQSFTAEDSFVEAGLYFGPLNTAHDPNDPIQYDLYEGTGTTGTLLSSIQFNLTAGVSGFHIEDFSSIALTIGDTYSLVASVVGTSPYWGMKESSTSYSGGVAIRDGSSASGYMALSVEPVEPVEAVPEPTTLALMGLGLAGIGFSRRRSKKAA